MNTHISSFSKSSFAALILLVGSVSWALLGAGLQVLATLQLLIPSLAYVLPIPWIGYAHLAPLTTFLFTYGWITSGFLGVLLILIPRISGIPFRYGKLLTSAAVLWQIAVLVGVAEIIWNGSSGIISLSFSRSVSCLFLVSFLVLGTGLARGLGRSWKSGPLLPRLYLLAALVALPLGLGTAELLLRGGLAPGALQIIAQLTWHSFLHHLWLTPLALVLLFQLVPTLTGRPVGSLSLGVLAWGATIGLGGWIGMSLASEGPIPSWLQSAGVVATILLAVAVWGNGTLLKPLLDGKIEECRRQVALRFLAVSLWSYLVSYAWLAFLAIPGIHHIHRCVPSDSIPSPFLILWKRSCRGDLRPVTCLEATGLAKPPSSHHPLLVLNFRNCLCRILLCHSWNSSGASLKRSGCSYVDHR